jgi:hypothetical protein
LLLATGALVLLTAAGLAMALRPLPPEPGVTPGNFKRLCVGMTLEEVEQSFGTPGRVIVIGGCGMSTAKPWNIVQWDDVTGRGMVLIAFAPHHDVHRAQSGKFLLENGESLQLPEGEETYLTRLRRLLPR